MKYNKKTALIAVAAVVLLLLCLIFPGVRNTLFGLFFDTPEDTSVRTEAPDTEAPFPTDPTDPTPESTEAPGPALPREGIYDSKEDVALYIHTYGELPKNFITKKEAEELGWSGSKKLDDYAKDKCIGGDYFGNFEGLLPEKKGRSYTECDIDTLRAKSRGVKRIVFSNDGLIFYTDDHYEHFEQLH